MHHRNGLLGNVSSSLLERNKTSKFLMAGKLVLNYHSLGWERTNILGNLLIKEVLLEGGNSCVFHSKFRNLIANLPW